LLVFHYKMEGESERFDTKDRTSCIERSCSTIRITSNCEDGAKIANDLNLKGVSTLAIKLKLPKNRKGACNFYRPLSYVDPGWHYDRYCDTCGASCSRRELCRFSCEECTGNIQLCRNCHHHDVNHDEVVDDDMNRVDGESNPMVRCLAFISTDRNVCIFCKKNPLIAIRDCLRDLLTASRSEIVLKHVSITTDLDTMVTHNSFSWSGQILSLISRLPTRPIVLIGENLTAYCLPECFLSRFHDSFGFISKLYVLTSSFGIINKTFANYFKTENIEKSFITDIGFVRSQSFKEYTLDEFEQDKFTRPSDIVTVAERILSMPRHQICGYNLDTTKLASDHCFLLRYNKDLVNNFNAICTILTLARKFPNKCQIITGFKTNGLPIVSNNPWGYINRDCFNIIMSHLHPRDWEHKDKSKRKGRLTIKTPAFAKNIINRHAKAMEIFEEPTKIENRLENVDGQEDYLKKRISDLTEELKDIPKQRQDLKIALENARNNALMETVRFWNYIDDEMAIVNGTKKRQRTKKVQKTEPQTNAEDSPTCGDDALMEIDAPIEIEDYTEKSSNPTTTKRERESDTSGIFDSESDCSDGDEKRFKNCTE